MEENRVQKVHLRKFKKEDASLMLEWMHDDSVVHDMRADFSNKILEDCKSFIQSANSEIEKGKKASFIHLAVVDNTDEYLGTVSLKDIDGDSAEFAITMRKSAMGKGYAREGMEQIIEYGFNGPMNLNTIYWCVREQNMRAVRFYDKNGYRRATYSPSQLSVLSRRGGVQPERASESYLVQDYKSRFHQKQPVNRINFIHALVPRKANVMQCEEAGT